MVPHPRRSTVRIQGRKLDWNRKCFPAGPGRDGMDRSKLIPWDSPKVPELTRYLKNTDSDYLMPLNAFQRTT